MKKLPIAGTSAAATAFCFAQVDGPGGLQLYVDGNGKITRDQGDLDHPVPNAFSIRNREDCPGMTPTCSAACYVEGLKKHASDTYTLYEHNSDTIREILADDQLADDWAVRMAEWISVNCTSFRWHVSGDVFSDAYAAWIRDVCRESPKVAHWIYTRSFGYVHTLMQAAMARGGNLAVNLSVDRDNWNEGLRTLLEVQGISQALGHGLVGPRLCYLTTADGLLPAAGLGKGDVIFSDYNLRDATPEGRAWFAALAPEHKQMVCPVDQHGKAPNRRCGPCARCLT